MRSNDKLKELEVATCTETSESARKTREFGAHKVLEYCKRGKECDERIKKMLGNIMSGRQRVKVVRGNKGRVVGSRQKRKWLSCTRVSYLIIRV